MRASSQRVVTLPWPVPRKPKELAKAQTLRRWTRNASAWGLGSALVRKKAGEIVLSEGLDSGTRPILGLSRQPPQRLIQLAVANLKGRAEGGIGFGLPC